MRIILAAGARSRVPRQCVEGIARAMGGQVVAVYDETNRIPAVALPMSEHVFVLKDMAGHKTTEMLRAKAAEGQDVVMLSSKRSSWEPQLRRMGLLAPEGVESMPSETKMPTGMALWRNSVAYLRALAAKVDGPIHHSDALVLSLASMNPLSFRSPSGIMACVRRVFGPVDAVPRRDFGLLLRVSRSVMGALVPPVEIGSDWRPDDQGRFARLWVREMLALVESGARSGIMSQGFRCGPKWSGPSPAIRLPASFLSVCRPQKLVNACLSHLPEVGRDAALRREDWDACAARAMERFEAGEDPGPYTRGPWPLSPPVTQDAHLPVQEAVPAPASPPRVSDASAPPDDKSGLLDAITSVAVRMQMRLDAHGASDLVACLSRTPLVDADFALSGDDVASAVAKVSDASWPIADMVGVVRILDDLTGDGDVQCSLLRREIAARDDEIVRLRCDVERLATAPSGPVPQDYVEAGRWVRAKREEELERFTHRCRVDYILRRMGNMGVQSLTIVAQDRSVTMTAEPVLRTGGPRLAGMRVPGCDEVIWSAEIPQKSVDSAAQDRPVRIAAGIWGCPRCGEAIWTTESQVVGHWALCPNDGQDEVGGGPSQADPEADG